MILLSLSLICLCGAVFFGREWFLANQIGQDAIPNPFLDTVVSEKRLKTIALLVMAIALAIVYYW